jgi:hypothetical protein
MSSLFAGVIYHFLGWMWVNLATAPMIIAVLLSAIWLHSIRQKERTETTLTTK